MVVRSYGRVVMWSVWSRWHLMAWAPVVQVVPALYRELGASAPSMCGELVKGVNDRSGARGAEYTLTDLVMAERRKARLLTVRRRGALLIWRGASSDQKAHSFGGCV